MPWTNIDWNWHRPFEAFDPKLGIAQSDSP